MKKLLAVLALTGALMAGLPQAASADTVSDEAAFVTHINQLRASKGMPALTVHPNLVAKARAWSATMAAAGRIWHSTLSDGITADWLKLGENVGMGGSVTSLHSAFVASPKHYANLVDPEFGYVGIGIVMTPSGTMFVSQMFMKMNSAPAPTTTTVTAPPAPAPVPAPVPAPTAAPAPKPRPAPTTTTAPAPPPPPMEEAPVAEAPVEAPVAEAPAPPPPAPEPSALLVSVLDRLRALGV